MSSSSSNVIGFAYGQDQFQQIVEDVLARAKAARCQRRRRRGLRRRGAVGVGAHGRARERRAQPRQVARRQRLPGPAPRQRQHLRLLARGAAADGAGGLRHRPLHRRRPGGRPARSRRPGHAGRGGARPAAVPPLGGGRRRGRRAGAALRGGGVVRQPPHRQFRRRRRLGAAVALLGRQQPRLPRRLCQLAPLPVGEPDRRQGRATCSATPGTRRCATPPRWPAPRPWAATPPSVRCRG